MTDRQKIIRGAAALLAVSAVCLLFIASYAGALHRPSPHEVPVAVTAAVPAQTVEALDASPAFNVVEVRDTVAARRAIDRRDAYGAVLSGPSGLTLMLAPAASSAVAQLLEERLVPQLSRGGTPVAVQEVHRLGADDGRGLVAFYLAIGWVVGGYLGATTFGLAFGTSPRRPNVLLRIAGLGGLGLVVGLGGALIASAIAGYDHGMGQLVLFGLLTVVGVGAATIAFQSLLGIAGTGLAILVFVVLGNPAAGGPYATELLPGLWRVTGPLLPPGAATTAVRDAAYFPDAPTVGPALVLLGWGLAGTLLALAIGGRGRRLTAEQERGAVGGTAA